MREELNRVYDNLFYDYPYNIDFILRRRYNYTEYDLTRAIRRAIDKSDTDNLLRADAKYFLLVNFHLLIIKPLIESSSYSKVININTNLKEIEDAIVSDIQTIVEVSIKDKSIRLDTNDNKISGHQVMSAIDQIWKQLKTTSFEIWG